MKSNLALAFAAMLGAVAAQERTVPSVLLPNARNGGATDWRYTTDLPSLDWTRADFDDAAWSAGPGGFGTGTTQGGSPIGTNWTALDIWIRKAFTVDALDFQGVILNIQHDEDAEVFINGVEAFTSTFRDGRPAEAFLSEEAKSAIKIGSNVIAIHCRNTDGPGYIDAGLSITKTMDAMTLIEDARFNGSEWKWSDQAPGGGWNDIDFDDTAWFSGTSGFGTQELYGTYMSTGWNQYEIWIRKKFTVEKPFSDYMLSYVHDDDMEVYINGAIVFQEAGSHQDYREKVLSGAGTGVVAGVNVIAIHCVNSGGGPQFLDAGLVGLNPPTPVAIGKPSRIRLGANVRVARVLYAGRDRLVRAVGMAGREVEMYDRNGRLRASLRGDASGMLSLPAQLGFGTYIYRIKAADGNVQGLLNLLP